MSHGEFNLWLLKYYMIKNKPVFPFQNRPEILGNHQHDFKIINKTSFQKLNHLLIHPTNVRQKDASIIFFTKVNRI